MKNQIITRILAHAALLCLPFVSIKASDWAAVPNPVATLTSKALATSVAVTTPEDMTKSAAGSTINFSALNDLASCSLTDDAMLIDRAPKDGKKSKKSRVSRVADATVADGADAVQGVRKKQPASAHPLREFPDGLGRKTHWGNR